MRAASLLGVFLAAKALVLLAHPQPWSIWALIAFTWQDAAAALAFGFLDALLLQRARIGWPVYWILAAYAAINVPVARVLSTPLTCPMLRAARGTLADSIRHHAGWGNLLCFAAVLAAAALLPLAARRLRPRALAAIGLSLAPVILLGPAAVRRADTGGLHRNSLAALVSTLLPRIEPAAFRGDWRSSPVPAGAPAAAAAGPDLRKFSGRAADCNVMMVILESAGARYLKPFGAAEDPMPRLTRLSRDALLFENAYCAYPESIKGLFSVICSAYPALDTPPELYAGVKTPSIAQVLAEAGYRTALFHSGRFIYLGMRSIIDNRGFQVLEDAGDIGGNRRSSFGVDEPSAVRRLLAWTRSLAPDERFFAAYLPVAGHHPYETPAPGPFPEDSERGRYLNALHYGDQALGQLIDGLEEQGRLDRTLWVIFGDHGEAFDQHPGNIGHTLFLYEENIHVPLLFALPGGRGEPARAARTASLIDVAPTILDLLGLAAPPGYQGISLIGAPPHPGGGLALFYTDYSLGLLGLRDGPWKFIYELDSGRGRLFNLDSDPRESEDLSSNRTDAVPAYRRHLLEWSAAQREALLSAGKSHE